MDIRQSVSTLLLLALASAANAGEQPSGAADFDVAGVKLGMTMPAAKLALSKHFNVEQSEISQGMASPMYLLEKPVSKTLTYQRGKERLEVKFDLKVPIDQQNPMVVKSVIYSMPNVNDKGAELAQAALKKYGSPTGRVNGEYFWCARVSGDHCEGMQPVLTVEDAELRLSDDRYAKRRADATNAAQDANPGRIEVSSAQPRR